MLVSDAGRGRARHKITAPSIANKLTTPVTTNASRRVEDGATVAASATLGEPSPDAGGRGGCSFGLTALAAVSAG